MYAYTAKSFFEALLSVCHSLNSTRFDTDIDAKKNEFKNNMRKYAAHFGHLHSRKH